MKTSNAFMEISFMAGTDITGAATEALRLAHLLNVNIKFSFNGVSCSIYANRECIGNIGEEYSSALSGEKGYKWASNKTSFGRE